MMSPSVWSGCKTLRGSALIVLLAVVEQGQGKNMAANDLVGHADDSTDTMHNLFDKLFHKAFEQASKAASLHHTDLEDTMLGKATHLGIPARGSRLYRHTEVSAGSSATFSFGPRRSHHAFCAAKCKEALELLPPAAARPVSRHHVSLACILSVFAMMAQPMPGRADDGIDVPTLPPQPMPGRYMPLLDEGEEVPAPTPRPALASGPPFLNGPEGIKYRDLIIGRGLTLDNGDVFKIVYNIKIDGDTVDTRRFDLPGPTVLNLPGDDVAASVILGVQDGKIVTKTQFLQKDTIFAVGNGRVIRGLDLALIGMRQGGVRQLFIPPQLAFGSKCTPSLNDCVILQGDSNLELTLKLLDIRPSR